MCLKYIQYLSSDELLGQFTGGETIILEGLCDSQMVLFIIQH